MRESEKSKLQALLKKAAGWVEARLVELPESGGGLSRLPSLCRYSLTSGGKRVRPFLVRSACEAVGGDPERSIHAACAVEMVHAYSLIHDDLPQMDDDDLRRGLPTLHVKAGVPQAVLGGDLLLVEAFGELARTPLGAERVSEMLGRMSAAAGPVFLVGGQYMDMNPPPDADRPWVERMILGKTAAMIRVSLELGALAGGAESDLVAGLQGVGDRLGYLFQLTDDILDRSGNTDEMGKRVGKDADHGKANTVSTIGLAEAKALALRLSDEISSELARLGGDWSAVALLARYLPHRRK